MNKLDKISYLSYYIRYSNSVFTEKKYMELPEIFFGYFFYFFLVHFFISDLFSYRSCAVFRSGQHML